MRGKDDFGRIVFELCRPGLLPCHRLHGRAEPVHGGGGFPLGEFLHQEIFELLLLLLGSLGELYLGDLDVFQCDRAGVPVGGRPSREPYGPEYRRLLAFLLY